MNRSSYCTGLLWDYNCTVNNGKIKGGPIGLFHNSAPQCTKVQDYEPHLSLPDNRSTPRHVAGPVVCLTTHKIQWVLQLQTDVFDACCNGFHSCVVWFIHSYDYPSCVTNSLSTCSATLWRWTRSGTFHNMNRSSYCTGLLWDYNYTVNNGKIKGGPTGL